MKKQLAFITVLAFTASLLFAACGSEKQDASSASEPTGQETESKTPASEPTGEAEPTPEPTKETTSEPKEPGPETTPELPEGTQTLRDFCDDEELDAWFDSLEEEPPLKLTYWIYGEAPFSMEFADQDLILKTAEALETVLINGPSKENPDLVEDAGGSGYYFELEDGSTIGFSFMMGCFKWKSGEYHDVANYGSLGTINDELEAIGNPQNVTAYADDGGFYTACLETYATAWVPEEGVIGGLFIYLDDTGVPPFIEIGRCIDETPDDPEGYLTGYLAENIRNGLLADEGITLEEAGEVQEYEFGDKTFAGQKFDVVSEDGSERFTMLVLVMKAKDSLLGEDHLVRFYAMYDETDEEQAEKMTAALNNAAKEFSLKQMWYESGEVQPDNYLFDFMNDEGVSAWYEKALAEPPGELVVTTDDWHLIEDPETIRKVLEALATVKIGDVAEETVGASGRQIYDFVDRETGDMMSFDFFENQYSYKSESYKVLDWGNLDELLSELLKSKTKQE